MIDHFVNVLNYQLALASLLVRREIDLWTWRYAARRRPIAVAGRHKAWVVDAVFHSRHERARIQAIAGALLIVAAIGRLALAFATQGFDGAALPAAVQAAILIGVGLLGVLDGAISLLQLREERHAELP